MTNKLTREQQLAVDAYRIIKRNPASWEQGSWRTAPEDYTTGENRTRCGTQLCWGGHLVVLDGGRFLTDNPVSAYFDKLFAEPGEYGSVKLPVSDFSIEYVSVPTRIMNLLGVTESEMQSLTSGRNTLRDIRNAMIRVLKVDPETGEVVKPKPKLTYDSTDYNCGVRGCFICGG